MSSSRKRQKELKRLRSDAESLWHDQQQVWDRANVIAREAGRQASDYARSDIAPTLKKGYHNHVQPRIERTAEYGHALKDGSEKAYAQAQPAVSRAVGNAQKGTSQLKKNAQSVQKDLAKDPRVAKALKKAKGLTDDPRVKDALAKAKNVSSKASAKADTVTNRSSGPGKGTIIGLILGGVLLVGVGYAIWQTFRADDELWVSDDDAASTATN